MRKKIAFTSVNTHEVIPIYTPHLVFWLLFSLDSLKILQSSNIINQAGS